MPRFAPNLYHQFQELALLDRLDAARACGFDAVEWHFPYAVPAATLRDRLKATGLEFTYAVMPVDWRRDKGLAGLPGREAECLDAARRGLDYLAEIGAGLMQVGAGQVPEGEDRARCTDVFIRNLSAICDMARGSCVGIAVEGVCGARFPDWVNRTLAETSAIVTAVDAPNICLVWDSFHLRMEETGPILPTLETYWDQIGHIQIRNAPEPLEPGQGEIDLHAIIAAIDARGWAKTIGFEFDTSSDTWSSLAWIEHYGYPRPVAPPGTRIGHPTRRAGP